jgi:hypothetical protein
MEREWGEVVAGSAPGGTGGHREGRAGAQADFLAGLAVAFLSEPPEPLDDPEELELSDFVVVAFESDVESEDFESDFESDDFESAAEEEALDLDRDESRLSFL